MAHYIASICKLQTTPPLSDISEEQQTEIILTLITQFCDNDFSDGGEAIWQITEKEAGDLLHELSEPFLEHLLLEVYHENPHSFRLDTTGEMWSPSGKEKQSYFKNSYIYEHYKPWSIRQETRQFLQKVDREEAVRWMKTLNKFNARKDPREQGNVFNMDATQLENVFKKGDDAQRIISALVRQKWPCMLCYLLESHSQSHIRRDPKDLSQKANIIYHNF